MDNKTKEIMEKLENGIKETMDSEKYKEFLKVQSQFHNYSFNNAMLIFLQRPDATRVAGYKTWQKLGRYVKKGEKGIGILAPCPYKYDKWVDKIDPKTNEPIKDPKTGEVIKEKKTIEGIYFKKVSVFDIKQTDGKELPTLCNELQGNSINAEKIVNAIKSISETPIVFKNIESGAKGYYSRLENIIAIKEGMSLNQTAKTLIHEYAHSKLHSAESSKLLDRATKEVQAESVAFIVSNRFGVDTSQYSFEYLASWSSGRDLKELKQSFDLIQKTSNDIISKIEKVLEKELQLQNKEHVMTSNINIKDKIVNQYINEFPAIKHISEKTASMINSLNEKSGNNLSIKDIKNIYKEKGKKLEQNYNKDDMQEFKELSEIIDALKKAQLTERKTQAHEKAMQKEVTKTIESVELVQ